MDEKRIILGKIMVDIALSGCISMQQPIIAAWSIALIPSFFQVRAIIK